MCNAHAMHPRLFWYTSAACSSGMYGRMHDPLLQCSHVSISCSTVLSLRDIPWCHPHCDGGGRCRAALSQLFQCRCRPARVMDECPSACSAAEAKGKLGNCGRYICGSIVAVVDSLQALSWRVSLKNDSLTAALKALAGVLHTPALYNMHATIIGVPSCHDLPNLCYCHYDTATCCRSNRLV